MQVCLAWTLKLYKCHLRSINLVVTKLSKEQSRALALDLKTKTLNTNFGEDKRDTNGHMNIAMIHSTNLLELEKFFII